MVLRDELVFGCTGDPFYGVARALFLPYLEGDGSTLHPRDQKKLKDLSAQSGRKTDDLVEDATAAYVDELLQTREMLSSRYEGLKSGRVEPIDGDEFFEQLRRREDELIKKHSPQ